MESLNAYTKKTREILKAAPGSLLINRYHIESERAYREIQEADVRKALENGAVTDVRTNETVVWQGKDVDGRKLELMLSLLDKDREETLVTDSAVFVRVGTAYDPSLDDKKLCRDWLKTNPKYEAEPNGRGVRRKVEVEIVRKPK